RRQPRSVPRACTGPRSHSPAMAATSSAWMPIPKLRFLNDDSTNAKILFAHADLRSVPVEGQSGSVDACRRLPPIVPPPPQPMFRPPRNGAGFPKQRQKLAHTRISCCNPRYNRSLAFDCAVRDQETDQKTEKDFQKPACGVARVKRGRVFF